MSDFEDEMDLDVPPSKDILFSSDNKGKRSAANLPVEAEDSLPWSVQSPQGSSPIFRIELPS